jgi:toxin ParE1/3/4
MIRVGARAWHDILDAAEYIGADSPVMADRFLAAVDETLEFLHDSPHVGRVLELPHPRLAWLRTWSVQRFPNHMLIYGPIEHGIELIKLIHGARSTDYLDVDE